MWNSGGGSGPVEFLNKTANFLTQVGNNDAKDTICATVHIFDAASGGAS